MPRASQLPGGPELEALLRTRSKAQVARDFEVTPQAVSNRLRRDGLGVRERPVERAEWIPWVVAERHQGDAIMRTLRDKVRQVAGEHVEESRAKRVDQMIETLDANKLAIGYDRDIGFFTTLRRGGEHYVTTRSPHEIDPEKFD